MSRASSSTGRSSPGCSRSSSCWPASARSSRCRSRNIPTSPRRRSTSAPPIPAPRPRRSRTASPRCIEQQLTGIDGLLYFSSHVELARPGERSPPPSRRAPIPTSPRCRCRTRSSRRSRACRSRCSSRASASPSPTPTPADRRRSMTRPTRATNQDVSDYLASNIQDPLSRVAGRRRRQRVRLAAMRCASGSIRSRLARYSLMPSDVDHRDHRARIPKSRPARSAACPQPPGQMLNATVTAQSRLQTPEQFAQHHPQDRSPSGATRAARATSRGSSSAPKTTASISRVNGHPGAGIADLRWRPAPTRSRPPNWSRREVDELAADLPAGLHLCLRQRHDRLHQAVDRARW